MLCVFEMELEKLWLLFIILATASCHTNPSLIAEPVVRGRVGGTAELACSLTSILNGVMTSTQIPLHVVEWVRLGYNVPVLIKFGSYTPRVHPNYKGRVSLAQEASLVVNGLTVEDEGWFECRILLLDRTTDEFNNGTWTFLSITAPPAFIKLPPAFVEVLLGDSVILSCDAFGNPKPTVTWIKEQDTTQVLNGSLSLVSATRDTAGMYKCHVSNSEGNLTHVTQLQVKGPPIIIVSPKDTTLNISQDAVLQCHADAYPSNLTYYWIKEGQNVHHVESLKSRINILVDGSLLVNDLIPEDTGNYTCIPTNGLLTPPTASAYLKVQYPARVVQMPRETYLPTGMAGTIVCPVQAEPPMLFVNWTKDGALLDLQQYPGWMVNTEGSVFIGTTNDNAIGMYTCTAYNSFGTMGQSEPTKVILKDPPSFQVPPKPEYLQEVGRELKIPCLVHGDPSPNITWTKVGSTTHSAYTVLSNGSLVLQPLSKNHHGAWECHATNCVATVSKSTMVLVLGTSPHAATAVSVDPGMNHVTVSWDPGFDGGYTQKFSVWVKPTTRGKHEWASFPVPISKSNFIVTGLQVATSYQFSVLPQNKLGSGPFSEIVTIRTLAPTTKPPTLITNLATLPTPTLLSINYTAAGVLLQWQPPPAASPPITAFILQARQENGKWVTLDGAINNNDTEIIVQGLMRDSNYELRLLSHRGRMVSEPSESVYISTEGMKMYPAPANLQAFVSDPLMFGVVGGACFLFVAIFLSLATACFMNNRREKRPRKKQDDVQSAFQKTRSPQACLPDNSPDSILKLKLCPGLKLFPKSSSFDRSDHSSFDKSSRSESHDHKKQLLSSVSPLPCYTLFESHLGGSLSPVSATEAISRVPDSHFISQPTTKYDVKKKHFAYSPGRISSEGNNINSFKDSSNTSSVKSEKAVMQEPPAGLTVDSSFFERPNSDRFKSISKCLSHQRCSYLEKNLGCPGTLLERTSFNTCCLERTSPLQREQLMHQAAYKGIDRNCQMTIPGTMGSGKESMTKDQEIYKTSHIEQEQDKKQSWTKSVNSIKSWTGAELQDPVWKPQDIQLRQKSSRPGSLAQQVSDYWRGCYFGNTSSPMERLYTSSFSNTPWDISPITSATSQMPLLSLSNGNTPNCLLQDTPLHTVQDSVAGDFSGSSHKQDNALSIISFRRVSPSYVADVGKAIAKTHCQERPTNSEHFSSSPVIGDHLSQEGVIRTQVKMSTFVCPASCSPQPPELAVKETQHFATEKETSPASHPPKLSAFLNHSFSEQSTSSCDNQKIKLEDVPTQSSLQSGEPKEVVRARSRKSERCVFSVSPSRGSPLNLFENEREVGQSNFSIVELSESQKGKDSTHPNSVSPVQTSTILEYLSLPGFVEMSVDEPTEDCQQAKSTLPSTEREKRTLLRGEPDVVPKDWETHDQDETEDKDDSQRGILVDLSMPIIPVEQTKNNYGSSSELVHRNLSITTVSSKAHDSKRIQVLAHEKRHSQPSQSQSKQLQAKNSSYVKQQATQLSPTQPLVSTTKKITNVAPNLLYHVQSPEESPSEKTQECQIQSSRTNKVTMRTLQAPRPPMKKSVSTSLCQSHSGISQPCQFFRKSISFGSDRWGDYRSCRKYSPETCYKDGFPNYNARNMSYSLVQTPASINTVPMPSSQGAIPIKPSRGHSPDREHHSERPYMIPPTLLLSHGPPVFDPPKFIGAYRRELDPRRQAAVFSEPSNCPLSYRERVRSVQHKYIPQDPPRPFSTHKPVAAWNIPCLMDSRTGPQRELLPRGYSWPSPHQVASPSGELQRELKGVAGMGKSSRDVEGGTGTGRASYASQSSGRGSVGPYCHGHLCQPISVTPTLLSSPETTEESGRNKRESNMQGQKSKRRNTSVDESYEWDATEYLRDPDILEAMKMEKTVMGKGRELRQNWSYFPTGLQDVQKIGLNTSTSFPPVSQPPAHQYDQSLSKERFNALMQEFQEYRRAQEFCSQEPCLPPNSDSDSCSALL